jgi:hypothetical protein
VLELGAGRGSPIEEAGMEIGWGLAAFEGRSGGTSMEFSKLRSVFVWQKDGSCSGR